MKPGLNGSCKINFSFRKYWIKKSKKDFHSNSRSSDWNYLPSQTKTLSTADWKTISYAGHTKENAATHPSSTEAAFTEASPKMVSCGRYSWWLIRLKSILGHSAIQPRLPKYMTSVLYKSKAWMQGRTTVITMYKFWPYYSSNHY